MAQTPRKPVEAAGTAGRSSETGPGSVRAAQSPSSVPVHGWWWSEAFPGDDPAQVPQARRWVKDLTGSYEAALITSELATNAVRHTRSGADGGRFSVEVCHAGAWARVVVGDQGSRDSAPHLVPGHGLCVVRELARVWGIVGDTDARYAWADITQPGGTAPETGRDEDLLTADIQRGFPGSRVWWGSSTRKWWAVPGGAGAAGITLDAPSPASLARMLATWHAAARVRPAGSPWPFGAVPGIPRAARSPFRPHQPPGGAAA